MTLYGIRVEIRVEQPPTGSTSPILYGINQTTTTNYISKGILPPTDKQQTGELTLDRMIAERRIVRIRRGLCVLCFELFIYLVHPTLRVEARSV